MANVCDMQDAQPLDSYELPTANSATQPEPEPEFHGVAAASGPALQRAASAADPPKAKLRRLPRCDNFDEILLTVSAPTSPVEPSADTLCAEFMDPTAYSCFMVVYDQYARRGACRSRPY